MTTPRRPRVLLTRRWPEAVERALAERFELTANLEDKPLSPAQIAAALLEYDAVCPTVTDKIDAAALAPNQPRARILGNFGVGYSHIDVERAKAIGLVVTNTPDVLSDCTADLAMTLMLMVTRRAGEGERELREGRWTGWRPTHLIGTKVTGAVLGIIGFGRIGQVMAERAHFGFGMPILVYNRSPVDPAILARTGARQVATIEELLKSSDVVSLHFPGGAANRHLINAERIAMMRPGAFLINTARGEVVDEEALAAALKAGRIGGAGLDVYSAEPQVIPALLEAPNAVLLPHLGSATSATREAMGFRVMDNLVAFFDGKEPPDRVA